MSSIESVNPYTGKEGLSTLEADVLWEYAKLSIKLKQIAKAARDAGQTPTDTLVADMRDLEKRMKLVLTAYQGSVFSLLRADMFAAEDAEDADQTVLHDGEQSYSQQWDSTEGESTYLR